MSLLHISINAGEPQRVAAFLARLMAGRAMPFPPFPDCWIAFAGQDDGSAIEVYPLSHTLYRGPEQIACDVGEKAAGPTGVHAAIGSPLERTQIVALATAEGWQARQCDRGPFECVEVWLENRLLVEVLDPEMDSDYRSGMTMQNWARMFGLDLRQRAEPRRLRRQSEQRRARHQVADRAAPVSSSSGRRSSRRMT